MSKKRLTLTVKGNTKTFSFHVLEDPKYLDEWRAEGIEIFELVNTIPVWVADIGLTRQWCFLQDIINFKNPF